MAFKTRAERPDEVEIPEAHRPPGSHNATLHALPVQRRHTHDVKGLLLFLPRTGLVVTPFQLREDGSWGCVVIVGNETYPRCGYDLLVSRWEIQRAVEVSVQRDDRYPFDLIEVDRAARNFRTWFRSGDIELTRVAIDDLRAALDASARPVHPEKFEGTAW
jgi:hypothetical protein